MKVFRYSKSFFFKLNNDGLITGIYIFVFDLSEMTDRSLQYASANKMSSLYISVMVVVNGAVFFFAFDLKRREIGNRTIENDDYFCTKAFCVIEIFAKGIPIKSKPIQATMIETM